VQLEVTVVPSQVGFVFGAGFVSLAATLVKGWVLDLSLDSETPTIIPMLDMRTPAVTIFATLLFIIANDTINYSELQIQVMG
jgi:hypothetical protein